jgi:hypothetical protein
MVPDDLLPPSMLSQSLLECTHTNLNCSLSLAELYIILLEERFQLALEMLEAYKADQNGSMKLKSGDHGGQGRS